MGRVLLDEGVPYGLGKLLNVPVSHVHDEKWSGISDERLLDLAEAHGFEILVTNDRNLQHQQNFSGRNLALVVLSTPK